MTTEVPSIPVPRVSVLMTVYNGLPYLPKAIESILAQTFQDFEFVIVNDGSTDGTAAYLATLEDPRIHVIERENGGTAAAANQGLQHCRGEYIARMDSDDISLPERLAEQVAFLDAHPEVGLVGAQMAPLGEKGVGRSLILPTGHQAIYKAMLEGRHGMAHSCILMRGALLRQIGGYWKLRYQDAWDMMMRMGEVSQLANIDKVLHYYRVHRGSLNGKAMQRMRFSIDYARELARRRISGLPAITVEEFQAQREQRGLLARLATAVDLHARSHYRLAVAEIHGGSPVVGYLRMFWASICQPVLFCERIARHVAHRLSRGDNSGVTHC
jgi:glycosyltransferase involved in cell wall biosynthesis